jgi:chemotaxis response regulator CheB
MIKLLIVDDSALMRRQLSGLFDGEPDFQIRTARNGREAVEENRAFQPDVVTLDINMPEMDGLTALSMIMVERPVAVVRRARDPRGVESWRRGLYREAWRHHLVVDRRHPRFAHQ